MLPGTAAWHLLSITWRKESKFLIFKLSGCDVYCFAARMIYSLPD